MALVVNVATFKIGNPFIFHSVYYIIYQSKVSADPNSSLTFCVVLSKKVVGPEKKTHYFKYV